MSKEKHCSLNFSPDIYRFSGSLLFEKIIVAVVGRLRDRDLLMVHLPCLSLSRAAKIAVIYISQILLKF
jgi:hypothetical protein